MPQKIKAFNGYAFITEDIRVKLGVETAQIHLNVGATGINHAAKLLSSICIQHSAHRISKFWSKRWGNRMDGIELKVGVWVTHFDRTKPPIQIVDANGKICLNEPS